MATPAGEITTFAPLALKGAAVDDVVELEVEVLVEVGTTDVEGGEARLELDELHAATEMAAVITKREGKRRRTPPV